MIDIVDAAADTWEVEKTTSLEHKVKELIGLSMAT